jgi:hypothetical protein
VAVAHDPRDVRLLVWLHAADDVRRAARSANGRRAEDIAATSV